MLRFLADILAALMDALASVALKNPLAMMLWAVLAALFFIPFAIWWEECGQYRYEKWW
jgi:hypothetical protein